jgi:branched-subunit amino acid ABC-type transport system permease component
VSRAGALNRMQQFAQIIVGGVLQGGVFAIVALGMTLVFRVTGVINLVQGGFCTLGALCLYSFQTTFGWPLPLAFLAAVVVTTALGALLGAATFVPALARLPDSSMLMLTAGLLIFINGLAVVAIAPVGSTNMSQARLAISAARRPAFNDNSTITGLRIGCRVC